MMHDIKALGDGMVMLSDAFVRLKTSTDAAIETERKEREALEMRINRGGVPVGGGGRGIDAAELKAEGEAFRAYIKGGDKTGLLSIKGMSVGSDPEGGYSVYPTISTAMTVRMFESSPLRRYARVVTIGTDSFEELLDIEDADAGWVAEKAARTDTATPDLGKLIIPVHEIYAMPKATQKLLDDSSIDVGAWLVGKVSSKFSRMETAAFYTGTGVGQPRGFLTYDAVDDSDETRDWGKLQYVPTGAAGGFVVAASFPGDRLIKLQAELKSEYRQNAVWMMNRRTAAQIRMFKATDGQYLWQDAIQAGQLPVLLGHPVVLAEDMPDVEAGEFPVAFGDFQAGYTIVDRHGERLLRDPFTDKPNVKFYMYRRVGGDVANFDAIKLLKVSET